MNDGVGDEYDDQGDGLYFDGDCDNHIEHCTLLEELDSEDETNVDGDSSNDEDEDQACEDLDNCNGSEIVNDETDMIPTLDEAETVATRAGEKEGTGECFSLCE